MTQAMRDTQPKTRPTDETRKRDERHADSGQAVAANRKSTVGNESAESGKPDSSVSHAPNAQDAAAASIRSEVADAADATEQPAPASPDTMATNASTVSVVATDPANTRMTRPAATADAAFVDTSPAAVARSATAGTRTGAAGEKPEPVGTESASDASLDAQPATTDIPSVASSDAPARTPGADSLLARSTADFAAQLAHARGVPSAGATQAADAAGASAPAANPTLHRSDVSTSIGDALFPGRFAAEVALLGTTGIERAEIRLQPRELGPVRVELSMSGESTRIAFSAVQPETRQAIEQSLPILKDLLAERGLTLGEASVSDGHAGRDTGNPEAASSNTSSRDGIVGTAADRPLATDARHAPMRRTLLDVYA